MPNFKYGVRLPDQAKLSFNSVVFATAKEADIAGRELLSRWFAPIGYEVIETEDKVNYRIVNDDMHGEPIHNRIERWEEEPINQLLDMTDKIVDGDKVLWTRKKP